MSELFPAQEVAGKSPRLKWLENHRLSVWKNAAAEVPCEAWLAAVFEVDGQLPKDSLIGEGHTEADAIADWARRNNVRLWNEEGV